MAQTRNGIKSMFFSWKCSRLDFATNWKLLKGLVCSCIYLQKTIIFSENCRLRKNWISGFREKGTENLRHHVLKVQQLAKKGWCNESPATINLKFNGFSIKGLPKQLKNFAASQTYICSFKNIPFDFIHELNVLMLKLLRMEIFVLLIYYWKLIM